LLKNNIIKNQQIVETLCLESNHRLDYKCTESRAVVKGTANYDQDIYKIINIIEYGLDIEGQEEFVRECEWEIRLDDSFDNNDF